MGPMGLCNWTDFRNRHPGYVAKLQVNNDFKPKQICKLDDRLEYDGNPLPGKVRLATQPQGLSANAPAFVPDDQRASSQQTHQKKNLPQQGRERASVADAMQATIVDDKSGIYEKANVQNHKMRSKLI